MTSSQFDSHLPPFIGREKEVDALVTRLQRDDCRMLTLVGPGGSGKTRLALTIASCLKTNYMHGTYFVPLQPLRSAEDIVTNIIEALPLQLANNTEPQPYLLNYLKQRQLLLVIDNFEHLLDGVDIIMHIVRDAPGVTLLVTSRVRLNLQVEHVWNVTGLDVPRSNGVSPDNYSAVQLFVDRAQRLNPAFSLANNREPVVTICQLTDGLPLAIELAASWVRSASCEIIAQEISRNIDILTTDQHDIPPRHRSMRAVMDHSWQQLTDENKLHFQALAVFQGGFTSEAALAVSGASLRDMSMLIDHSLVVMRGDGRYDMQELLRQYAEEMLGNTSHLDGVLDRHCEYYSVLLAEHEADLKSHPQQHAMHEMDAEFDNIRAAWLRAVAMADFVALSRMMEALTLYCDMRSRFYEGEALLHKAFAELSSGVLLQDQPALNRLRICWLHVWMLPERSPVPTDIHQHILNSLSAAQQQHDTESVARCQWLLGEVERVMLRPDEGIMFYEQAMTTFRDLQSDYYVGRCLRGIVYCINVGTYSVLKREIDWEHSKALNQEHIQVTRRIGDKSGLAHAMLYDVAYRDDIASMLILREAADIMQEVRDWKSLGVTLYLLAGTMCLTGELDEAHQMATRSLQLLQECGWSNTINSQVTLEFTNMLRADLPTQYDGLAEIIEQYGCVISSTDTTNALIKAISYALLAFHDHEERPYYLGAAFGLIINPFLPISCSGCLAVVAMIFAEQGEKQRAVQLLGLAFTYSDSPFLGWMMQSNFITKLRDQLKTELGREVYETEWQTGATLDLETTVIQVMSDFNVKQQHPTIAVDQTSNDLLSERELEVLALIAQGNSNRDIATTLVIGVSTVKKHINHIYSKLAVKNRTSAVACARELNLL